MFKHSQLMKFCTSVFLSLGMDKEKAIDTSEILIEAVFSAFLVNHIPGNDFPSQVIQLPVSFKTSSVPLIFILPNSISFMYKGKSLTSVGFSHIVN